MAGEIIAVNKPIGITSYDVIRQLKRKYPGQKIGHAGTLDPLANGVLVCLVGSDATKRQSEFMGLEKEYEFSILFGFETDTYDVLGIVQKSISYSPQDIVPRLEEVVQTFLGKQQQAVPAFSAVKIEGMPSYRREISGELPQNSGARVHDIEIKEIELLDSDIRDASAIHEEIIELVSQVNKGFRQSEVLQSWENTFSVLTGEAPLLKVTLRAVVSKGTYVRAIAHDMGKLLGIGGCTTTITRIRVGDFRIDDAEILT